MPELDQLQLQQRIDMREAAEDVLKRYKRMSGKVCFRYEIEAALLANHVITLLDEAEQVCKVANELTKQIEKIIEQRDKMAEALREVVERYDLNPKLENEIREVLE